MHWLDWAVLIGSLVFIVVYGIWKTRNTSNVESYLTGDRDLKWWTIGLSIMATQASGITFLSTPGQGFEDGLRFVQFYFGLPLAMVILAIWILPKYYSLKVYTAYEYLEQRFDLKTRTLTSILFLLQRGMAAGLTIYAPAIIMSTILGWNLFITNLTLGGIVIIYTALGGTKAVSETQQTQMTIIFVGLIAALVVVVLKLPQEVSFTQAIKLSGQFGKINPVDFHFDPSNRYNFWSGMLGGTFLFLSYFGTDQSQVQRYINGKTLTESRLGLIFNGLLKVPMQFLVLFTGVMVFVFFQFIKPPVHYNSNNLDLARKQFPNEVASLEQQQSQLFQQQQTSIISLSNALNTGDENLIKAEKQKWKAQETQQQEVREKVKKLIKSADAQAETDDTDYVFITFVTKHLPIGLVGLLIAVIFAASMSSTSSELNALATTSIIDIYKRSLVKDKDDHHYFKTSQWLTVLWGLIALTFASVASLFDNLIEAINIVGSLFYGVILGIFMTGFFIRKVKADAVFIAALISESLILFIFYLNSIGYIKVAYLWLNLYGCLLTMSLSLIFQSFSKRLRV